MTRLLVDTHVVLWHVLDDARPTPFDRLPIAQARVERLPILTADPAFAAYDVEAGWE